jgi:hypothetical protein
MRYRVMMKAMTWERESHGLYDYESRRISKFECRIHKEGELVRGKDEVFFDTETKRDGNEKPEVDEAEEEEDTSLFRLEKANGNY